MLKVVCLLLAPLSALLAAGFDGKWDGIITSNDVNVPFRMEITESPARVCFFEGTQPVCSTSARVEGTELTAGWDFINTELKLSAKDGGLSGSYQNLRTKLPYVVTARRPVAAPASEKPPAKFDGEWEVRAKERPGPAFQLLLQQKGQDLQGTILRVDGDVGTLVGKVDGNHFLISHFAGDRPTRVEGTLQADGSVDLILGKANLYALRPAEARARHLDPPLDPATYARAKDPHEKFHFSLPGLDGKTVTESAFAGKALVVTITGSWCPNCRDEAPFLADLYRRYHSAGLEIVGFCFEYDADPTYAPLKAFIRKYGIAYPMLLAGAPEGNRLHEVVPQVQNLSAYPTSIYIGRDGRIRAVHTGFPSSGSGEELERVKHEVESIVERMLAEKTDAPLQ